MLRLNSYRRDMSLMLRSLFLRGGTPVDPTLCLVAVQLHAQNGEGDGWLERNSDTRTGFVHGYIIGLSRGFAQGCLSYERLVPQQKTYVHFADLPSLKCSRQAFGFSKPISFYVEQITRFYAVNAEDRKVPFEEVLKKLSDNEHLTPKQMHEWFKQHGYGKFRQ
jgi:hypothetical protein